MNTHNNHCLVAAARERTGDASIGTRVEGGRVQIVRVSYPDSGRGAASVTPVSAFLSLA